MSSAPAIVTFGCRLNTYEFEVIREHALAAGLADAVIIHTCAVTAEAERQARQAIRRARRERPAAKIIVTGCSAQVAEGVYAAMPEVDAVVGNADKLQPATWQALAGSDHPPRLQVTDIMQVKALAGHLVSGLDGRTRAFVQVQNGCDHRCTFCIIPYGRGPNRSVEPAAVVAEVKRLVAHGYREIVLTGVDIASYGKDAEPSAPGGLCRRLLDEAPELPRLRLSSIDPAEIDPQLERLIADEPRLMPHLHLSLQAGDDLVLKRMKRRHSRSDVLRLTRRLRSLRPEIVFGADLIAGFPTENEAMFARTLSIVEEARLTFLHVFPYSPRPRTPAALMPQVPPDVRRERAARLRAAGGEALDRYLSSEVGRRQRVLVESDDTGRTETFAAFRFEGDPAPRGQVVETMVTAVRDGAL